VAGSRDEGMNVEHRTLNFERRSKRNKDWPEGGMGNSSLAARDSSLANVGWSN